MAKHLFYVVGACACYFLIRRQYFGIELIIKIYFGSNVPVFENRKKCYITPHYCVSVGGCVVLCLNIVDTLAAGHPVHVDPRHPSSPHPTWLLLLTPTTPGSLHIVTCIKEKIRMCGGLLVSVPATRSPVPGSNLGPEPPQRAVGLRGAADRTVNTVKIK